MDDSRNLQDHFKGLSETEIVCRLDHNGVQLEIAIENTLRDYNMGSIVRNANAFGVRTVHVIGRKQWNKRGAMMTDKYLHIKYYVDSESFQDTMKASDIPIFAIDNNCISESIMGTKLPKKMVMLFGQEGPGLSDKLRKIAIVTLHIPQKGSTRSMNVGVASGIALYEWARQNR